MGRGENGGSSLSPRAPALSQRGEVLLTCTSAPTIVRCGDSLTLVSLYFFQHKQGKVGPDGKELIPQESPRVGDFGFVVTPLVPELMTWGEVESTPLQVDRAHGPTFKILGPGRREHLSLKMAHEAPAKNQAKQQEALQKVTENLASLTLKDPSPALSPALQRLVSRTASK